MRDAMACWASGVSVVTTTYENAWKGTTASAFVSISIDPPLVLICLASSLYTRRLIEDAGVFAVNVLNARHQDLARIFAGMRPDIEDRFAYGTWQTAVTGSPVLTDACSWVDCSVVETLTHGDRTLFLGNVHAANALYGEPLVYNQRTWGTFLRFPENT